MITGCYRALSAAVNIAALMGTAAPAVAHSVSFPNEFQRCKRDAKDGVFTGLQGVLVDGRCVSVISVGAETNPVSKTRELACTSDRTAIYEGHVIGGSECDNAPACPVPGAGPGAAGYLIRAIELQVQNPTTKAWVTVSFYCPAAANPAPAPTAADIRDRAIRLLPKVAVKTTGPNTLVNIETVLWAATGTHRDLGTVTVVGQPVRLRIGFAHADWTFGDGHTDRTTTPGKPYDKAGDPCNTKQCPDYYGHTYAQTGQLTATVRIAWNADYSLDGGASWQPVSPTPLVGPRSEIPIRVRETHVVLVAPTAADD